MNGKRHGKGKEYYNIGRLLYEGEYLNGNDMEKEKYIMEMINYYMKVNI